MFTSSLGKQMNRSELNANSWEEKEYEPEQKSVKWKTADQYRKANRTN